MMEEITVKKKTLMVEATVEQQMDKTQEIMIDKL